MTWSPACTSDLSAVLTTLIFGSSTVTVLVSVSVTGGPVGGVPVAVAMLVVVVCSVLVQL